MLPSRKSCPQFSNLLLERSLLLLREGAILELLNEVVRFQDLLGLKLPAGIHQGLPQAPVLYFCKTIKEWR